MKNIESKSHYLPQMKKHILLAALSCGVLFAAQAQQRPQYSQYMLNNFLLNPAVAGTSEHYDIKAGYRDQWSGFKDNADPNGTITNVAPRTFYASAHAHLGQHIGPYRGKHRNEPKNFHGLGALVVADKTGPTSRTSFYASYAFNMKMAENFRASVGAFVGAQQFKLDGTQLRYKDPLLTIGEGITKTVPDATLGIWLYGTEWYGGVSSHQIFQNKLSFNDGSVSIAGENKLSAHYFATAGYLFKASKDFKIIPSILVKYVSPTPVSFDVNLKTRYKDMVWVGASYRQDGSLVFLVGGVVKNLIEFGYAFDYTTSAIGKTYASSHEVLLGIRLQPQGRVTSPSDFW